MKKHILAAAVSAASLSVFSSALAADNLTLYGAARVGVIAYKAGATGSSNYISVDRLFGSSRWGITGTEDLGSGLGGFFKFEGGLSDSYTGGSGAVADRYAYVGVNTPSAGSFSIGKNDAAYYLALSASDIGVFANNHAVSYMDNVRSVVDSSIFWNSPNWNGLQMFADINLNNRTSDYAAKPKLKRYGLGGTYTPSQMKALNLGLAYDYSEDAAVGATEKEKTTLLGLSVGYTFANNITPTLLVEQLQVKEGSAKAKQTAVNLTVNAAFGKSAVIFGLGQRSKAKANGNTVADSKSDAASLEYQYSLSKRTQLLAGYEQVKNQKNAAFEVQLSGARQPSASLGKRDQKFGFGIAHAF